MKKLFIVLCVLWACSVSAQVVGPGFVQYVTSAPSGSCSQNAQMQVILGPGTVYTCQSGTWAQSGAGGVTSVGLSINGGSSSGIFAVTGSPVTTSGTLNYNLSGTSGGVPYFSSGSILSGSSVLTANLPVIGGGAGVAPSVGTRTGNTTQFASWTGATTASKCVDTDANGNLQVVAADCNVASAFSSITAGTNTGAAMLVGSGASLGATGTGTITPTFSTGLNKPGNNTKAIDVSAYGVTAHGIVVYDAGTTLNNATVTSATATFTSAMNGWSAYAVDTFATKPTLICPQATVTFVNSTTITMSTNCTGATGTNRALIVGPDETTALVAADNAAAAACAPMMFPAGNIVFTLPATGIFTGGTTVNCGAASGSGGYEGRSFYGTGVTNTYLLPLPSGGIAGCTGGPESNACMFGTKNGEISKLTVMGPPLSGDPGKVTVLLAIGDGMRSYDLDCIGWGANVTAGGSAVAGMKVYSNQGEIHEGGSIYCGNTPLIVGATASIYGGFWRGGTATLTTAAMVVTSSATVTTFNNKFQNDTASQAVLVGSGTHNSYSDIYVCAAACTGETIAGGATGVFVNAQTCLGCTTGSNGIFLNNAASVAYILNSRITGVGAGAPINSVSGSVVNDLGGNVYTGTQAISGTFIANSGQWSCTNVTPVTVNTSTTADQNLMACTIPAGTLNRVGRSLRIWVAGVFSTAAASTASISVKAKLCTVSGCGSGTVITPIPTTTGATAALTASNLSFELDGRSTTQTAGASSAYEAHGALTIDLSATATVSDSLYADTNTATVGTIDSTAQLFLQITGAFSAASASNTMTERQLIAETMN